MRRILGGAVVVCCVFTGVLGCKGGRGPLSLEVGMAPVPAAAVV